MCGTMLATKIIEAMDDMVLSGNVFTAFDITEAARAMTSDNVVHDDVRNIVSDAFNAGDMNGKGPDDYSRESRMLDLLSHCPVAVVYFPDTKSASDHALISVQAAPVASSVSTPVSTAPVVVLGDDEYKTAKDGRIQITRKLIAQVTPVAGTYDVLVNGTLSPAKLDDRGGLRVGLRQFGIRDSKVKVTVDTTNNTINVTTV